MSSELDIGAGLHHDRRSRNLAGAHVGVDVAGLDASGLTSAYERDPAIQCMLARHRRDAFRANGLLVSDGLTPSRG